MRRARTPAGFTILEVLIVIALLGIVTSLAVIGTQYARAKSAEAVTVAALGTINQAQFAYMQGCGNQSYAPDLLTLGTPPPGADSAFLSPDLAREQPVQKSGYVFVMGGTVNADAAAPCNGGAALSSYFVTADPVTPGHSGMQSFGTNSDRVIFGDAVTYVGSMPESGAPQHGKEVR